MGFFDNVLKAVNKAKNFVEDIQDKANEAYSSKPAQTDAPAQKPAQTSTPAQKPAEAVAFLPESVTITMPTDVTARECKTTFFDCDENEKDVEIEVSMSIDNRFHVFDSGAGEIDVSYTYSPEITDDNGYGSYEAGVPYILMGFEQQQYNILKAFNEGKALPSQTTLQKVEGNDKVLYKSTLIRFNEKCVAYHFKRGCSGEKLLYHFEACYPTKYAGTALEKIILDALDLMALSYKETIVG